MFRKYTFNQLIYWYFNSVGLVFIVYTFCRFDVIPVVNVSIMYVAECQRDRVSFRRSSDDFVTLFPVEITCSHIKMVLTYISSPDLSPDGGCRANKCSTLPMSLAVHIQSWLFSNKTRLLYLTSYLTL